MADQFDAYIIDRDADTYRPSEGWKSASADELMEGDVTAKLRDGRIRGRLLIKVD